MTGNCLFEEIVLVEYGVFMISLTPVQYAKHTSRTQQANMNKNFNFNFFLISKNIPRKYISLIS